MDGLNISNAIGQTNAITSESEIARGVRADRLRDIMEQKKRDVTSAQNKTQGDRNNFLLGDTLSTAEAAYSVGTSLPQTISCW